VFKTLIKLAIVVLAANAIWRAGSAYVSYYRFKDAVADVAVASRNKTDDDLRKKVMQLAMEYDAPVDEDAVAIRHEDNHTYIDASYEQTVALFPGYERPWAFSFTVDSQAGAAFRRELPNP
jgi:hypothetical protein